MPSYKEANPGVFTCVTFPFLFGVMFGDIFTGGLTCVFVAALYYYGSGASPTSILGQAYVYRHFLAMCGLFSVYCGFLYNDFTSLPTYLFGDSCFSYKPNNLTPELKPNCVYGFGVDPAWYMSTDELTFLNSLKMKTSVILGVFQMSLGICMRGANAIYFRRWVDFFFEFLPMLLMMLALFGFMDLMIIMKWLTNWNETPEMNMLSPSIITAMITMCIQVGNNTSRELSIVGDWETQTMVMQIMLLVVVVCAPTMLLAKPIIYGCCLKQAHHEDEAEDEITKGNDDDYTRAESHQNASGKGAKVQEDEFKEVPSD